MGFERWPPRPSRLTRLRGPLAIGVLILTYVMVGLGTYGYLKARRGWDTTDALGAGTFWPIPAACVAVSYLLDLSERLFTPAPPPPAEDPKP